MTAQSLVLAAATALAWGRPGEPASPWREVRHAGRTRYAVVERGGKTILAAESRGQNSAWLRPLPIAPAGVTLRWRWRVLAHPAGADPEVRARDDRAAAVLVVVRRSFLPGRTRTLLYQWAPSRPRGEWSRSPYSHEVRTLVVENAPADSLWREETRDLSADLARAFGAIPTRIESIGVICDTDNTRAHAAAEFGAIEVVAARAGE